MTKRVGPLRISFGWGEEPPFAGARNSVEVEVSDTTGAPIEGARGELRAEGTFGDQRVELPLVPQEEPGVFRAPLVPTRPGTYSLRIIGRALGRAIDVVATCSDKTFECVIDPTEIQFPAKDPSASQLAERLSRGLPRASATARSSHRIAIAALAVALLSLAASVGFGVRNSRKSR